MAEPVVETKSKEDDFFGNFDNAELKQNVPVEAALPAKAQLVPGMGELFLWQLLTDVSKKELCLEF